MEIGQWEREGVMGDEKWGLAVLSYLRIQMIDRGRPELPPRHELMTRDERLADLRATSFYTLLAPCSRDERHAIIQHLVDFLKYKNSD